MINLTESAKKRIKEIISEEGNAKHLRVAILAAGCAGFQYDLSIDEMKSDDVVNNIDGITILMDKKASLYLSKITIDFFQEGLQSGFKIDNPLSSGSCGCGISFSV